jgi:predicted DNA-binding transcriptional regulator YafY
MSINKNAYIRYQTLDKCFSNFYRRYFIEDLLEEVNIALEDFNGGEFNIKRRQLFDDICFMESEAGWSIPLERIPFGKRVYYRYEDKNFSIKNQKISDNEIAAINSALLVLYRFKDMSLFEWINELSPKLQSLFREDNLPEVISFDHNEYLQGLEYLPQLYQSIINQVPLEIEYEPFKKEKSDKLIIHPYYLKQYNKRWFLFGFNEDNAKLNNLALDRIRNIEPKTIKFKKNESIEFKEYFEDVVGVTVLQNKEPIKIQIKLGKEIAPYVLSKPIHGSQRKIKSNAQSTIIEIEVIPNFELKNILLSFGAAIEIISPESYRNEMINTINQMINKYIVK